MVRRLFELFEARRWDDAAALVHPDVVVEWPVTGERFRGRDRFIGVNRAYPEGWTITVGRVLAAGPEVASEVFVTQDGVTFVDAAFWTVEDGLIRAGVEYWATVGGERAPAWRARWAEPG